jgi:hypothetical protein
MEEKQAKLFEEYTYPVDPYFINRAHERWYEAQPYTLCHRCDRPFPNVDSGKTEFCSKEGELGYSY